MNINLFFDWLFSDSGAGWIFGIISSVGLLLSYGNRKRVNKVVFKEVAKLSLIEINNSVLDKIKITYNDTPANRLAQLHVAIQNQGSEVINRPIVHVSFSSESRILNIYVVSNHEDFSIRENIENNKASLELPYLNPYKEHKHTIELFILLNGDVDSLTVTGSGKGWSTVHMPIASIQKLLLEYITFILLAFGTFIGIGLIYATILYKFYGINPWNVSLNSLIAYSPLFIVLIGLTGWMLNRYIFPLRKGGQMIDFGIRTNTNKEK